MGLPLFSTKRFPVIPPFGLKELACPNCTEFGDNGTARHLTIRLEAADVLGNISVDMCTVLVSWQLHDLYMHSTYATAHAVVARLFTPFCNLPQCPCTQEPSLYQPLQEWISAPASMGDLCPNVWHISPNIHTPQQELTATLTASIDNAGQVSPMHSKEVGVHCMECAQCLPFQLSCGGACAGWRKCILHCKVLQTDRRGIW